MATVSRERLIEIETEVFERGQGTVEDAASAYSRDDLTATIRAARQALRATLDTLPDAAFDPQLPDDAGEPVWSAGEIVAHLTRSMLYLQTAFRRLTGDDPQGEPPDAPAIAALSRPSTLILLDRADRELDAALAMLPAIPDAARTTLGPLGDLGPRGLLLLHAMHEWDHAMQAADLVAS